jgi:hypothetical protein
MSPDTPTTAHHQLDPLAVRDHLRLRLALLGIDATVHLGTIGLRRNIVLHPLSLDEARMLADALEETTPQ